MQIENNHLVLETRPCSTCNGSLRINEWITCSACNGSGKKDPTKPKGRNCPVCGDNASNSLIRGKVLSIGTGICPCTRTETPGIEAETIYDSAPDSMFQALEFRVYPSNRHQTFAENLLGVGVYSCSDYGRYRNQTVDELIADVRKHTYVQACKFVHRDDMTVCDHIGIFCNDSGYTVQAVWGDPAEIENNLKRGLSYSAGMAVGAKLAGLGLNGTMLAAGFRREE